MRRTASIIRKSAHSFQTGEISGRRTGHLCLSEAVSSSENLSFSSLAKGVGRAWDPACTLLMLLFFLATAVQAATPGTLIQNTALARYRVNGDQIQSSSNTVPLTTTTAPVTTTVPVTTSIPTTTTTVPSEDIPTLSEWGLIIFMSIIMGLGVVTLFRRRME